MHQRDFIMRMIEMIAELIAGILGLIKKGNFQKATQLIDEAYHDYLKQDATYFNSIPTEQLTDELISKHNFSNGHLEILSNLFFAQAELYYAQNNFNESLPFYQKALLLLEFVLNESQTFSFDKQSKSDLIQNRIAELDNKYSSV
jgi:tetratricopeptide (TPR) repeat protein